MTVFVFYCIKKLFVRSIVQTCYFRLLFSVLVDESIEIIDAIFNSDSVDGGGDQV